MIYCTIPYYVIIITITHILYYNNRLEGSSSRTPCLLPRSRPRALAEGTVCVNMCIYIYIYIYIYIHRERERERESISLCIYIYIYRERER